MSNFVKNIFENNAPISLEKLALSFFSIITIRGFLENFSSPHFSNYFFAWTDTYLEFPLYYTSVFLSFAILLYLFSKKSLEQIFNFEIKIFIFILVPPIIDLFVTNGKGLQISYLLIEPNNLVASFFKTMNPLGFEGITPGVHAAAYLILFSMSVFIYRIKRKIVPAILISFIAYIMLFCYAIIPTIVSLPQYLNTNSNSISQSYLKTIETSWIITTQEQTNSPLFFSQKANLSRHFNQVTTQIYFILVIIQSTLLFFIHKPTFAHSFKKNIRPERLLYWLTIATIGIIINHKLIGGILFSNAINIIMLLDFILLLFLNVWFAVCVNDAEDIPIDEISNPERPLAKKIVSIDEWKSFQRILFILMIFGLAIMNHAVAFLIILAQAAYYIYSANPFRLKNNFATSSLLIGIASSAVAMAGFFLVSADQQLTAFPIKALFIIGISYALISNFKDIKDFAGDKHEKMKTLPVIFGIKKSKIIISLLCSIVLIALPFILHIYSLLLFSVCASFFLFYLFNKKEYQEKYIFLVFFIYLIALYLTFK